MPKQFTQPAVGKSVQVTTRFPEIYLYAKNKWRDTVYTGVVGRNDKTVPEGSFLLITPDDPRMPTRVIALNRVIKLVYADGSVGKSQKVKPAVRVWQVQGSKGNVYTVTERNGVKDCSCPGFVFRRACKHVQ